MTKIKTKTMLRCSSLPLFFDCPPAVLNPDKYPEVRVVNGSENLGTDIHAAIQRCVETGEINLNKIKQRYEEVDYERAVALTHNGLEVVRRAKKDMKNPRFEQEVSFETNKYLVTGHIDLMDADETSARVVDFKTGRTRDNHIHQMMGYAVGVWTKMGRPSRYTVSVCVAYLEDLNDITPYEFSVADMTDWLAELDALPLRYAANRRCVYCTLQNRCKVFQDYLNGSVKLLNSLSGETAVGVTGKGIRQMTPDSLSRLSVAAKMSDIMVKRWRDAVKAEALVRGDIKLGNGNVYTIKPHRSRVLLTPGAMRVFARYVTPAALLKATKLSLNDLMDSAVRGAKGPMKALLRKEIEKNLDRAGAVVYTVQPRLETVNEKGTKWPIAKTKKSPSPPPKASTSRLSRSPGRKR